MQQTDLSRQLWQVKIKQIPNSKVPSKGKVMHKRPRNEGRMEKEDINQSDPELIPLKVDELVYFEAESRCEYSCPNQRQDKVIT